MRLELSILHFVFFYENLKKISEHESKSGFFPIPIAYWSGFGIFKQNRDNPDEIGMVGQSGHKIFIYTQRIKLNYYISFFSGTNLSNNVGTMKDLPITDISSKFKENILFLIRTFNFWAEADCP